MAALVFPTAPAVGQIFQASERQPTFLWDGTVWKQLAQPKGVDTGGFRNLFINGDMGVYRRNFPTVPLAGASPYLADRWQWSCVGTQLTSVAWPPTGLGAFSDLEAPHALSLGVTSVAGAGNFAYLIQKIEFAQALISGQPYTLSGWVYCSAALKFGVDVQRYYGSGGSPSAQETVYRGAVAASSGVWKRFTVSFLAPSMAGKTLGSNGDHYCWVQFWLDAGSTYAAASSNIGQQSGTWGFTGLQLERGIVATPFERRPPAIERMLCQRYFNSGLYYMSYASPSSGGYGLTIGVEFPATMRAAPTMVRNWSGYGNVSSFAASGTYPWAHYEQIISTGISNVYGNLFWEASAEL